MRSTLAVFAVVSLAIQGCAVHSGVVSVGPDTFMVSRQAASGFSGTGKLKAEAMREAQQYCGSQHKELRVISATESEPPYVFGNFPKAEVQFMCLAAGDPELTRPRLASETISPAQPPTPGEAQRVLVAIDSDPQGADVLVDGAFVGNTPLPQFSLTPGEHQIEIQKPGFVSWTRKLLVARDAPTTVRAVLAPVASSSQ